MCVYAFVRLLLHGALFLGGTSRMTFAIHEKKPKFIFRKPSNKVFSFLNLDTRC